MKKRTNIYLRPDQSKLLKALSKKTGSSASELVRRAVDEYIEKENTMGLKLNAEGKIIPDRESFESVEREHAGKTDAEKWRLAQMTTMIKWFQSQEKKSSKKKS
jgi:predicted DNA-binding protein